MSAEYHKIFLTKVQFPLNQYILASLKSKTLDGIIWNTIGKFAGYAIEFIVGIILARLLGPEEFGLIGMIMVFLNVSNVFINSGFSQALVRKQDCTQSDYSTAFFFNLFVGALFTIIIYFSATPISNFYLKPELRSIIEVMSALSLIGALTLIQQSILTKRLDFKIQTIISLIASILSGLFAVIFAIWGFGVWSLVSKIIVYQSVNTILLWILNQWKPIMIFSLSSFKELFGFGSKLLISGLIGTFYTNMVYLFIGKIYSAKDLGYYTRSELFKNFFSQNIESIATSVGYPVLSKLQNDKMLMKNAFRKIMTTVYFIVLILMAGLALMAEDIILLLIGYEWLPVVPMLQLLCITGIMYPVSSININLLNVLGRSDLYLKLQTLTQLFIIPILLAGYFGGIYYFLTGIVFRSVISYFIYARYTNKMISYKVKEQLWDISTSTIIVSIIFAVMFISRKYININFPLFNLIFQTTIFVFLIVIVSEITKNKDYFTIKKESINYLQNIYKRKIKLI